MIFEDGVLEFGGDGDVIMEVIIIGFEDFKMDIGGQYFLRFLDLDGDGGDIFGLECEHFEDNFQLILSLRVDIGVELIMFFVGIIGGEE